MNACTAQNVRRISSMLKTVQVRMRRTRLQYIPSRRRRRRLSSSRRVRSASISNSIVVVHDGLGSRPTREGASGEAEGRGKVGDDVMTTRGVMKMLRGLFLRGKQDEMSFPCSLARVLSPPAHLQPCICRRSPLIV